MFHRFTFFISLFIFSSQFACAAVHRGNNGLYELQIEDVHGIQLNTFSKNHNTYVLGQHNQRYNIRVFNRSNQRIEAVITVDGRDSISGDLGDYAKQRGYIVEANDSILIDGFRRSLSTVAAFRFTHPSDGYSARRGTPQHAGVIGVAIFKEKRRHHPKPRKRRALRRSNRYGLDSGSPDNAGSQLSRSVESTRRGTRSSSTTRRRSVNNLGTRFGENRFSQAIETPFRRIHSSRPDNLLTIYYDNHAGLVARGIQIIPERAVEPNPFPNRRFAPAP